MDLRIRAFPHARDLRRRAASLGHAGGSVSGVRPVVRAPTGRYRRRAPACPRRAGLGGCALNLASRRGGADSDDSGLCRRFGRFGAGLARSPPEVGAGLGSQRVRGCGRRVPPLARPHASSRLIELWVAAISHHSDLKRDRTRRYDEVRDDRVGLRICGHTVSGL
jgi:hypothetical protein